MANRQRRSDISSHFIAHCLLPLMALLLSVRSPLAAEYKLDIGDTLEFSVAGLAELHGRILIEFDGRASFPLIGELQASGLTISELRAKVRELLPREVYRNRQMREGGSFDMVRESEISLRIAEIRPIYVNGDVAKPGELAYRSRITVRHAIALAGGFDISRSLGGTSIQDALSLKGQYESLNFAIAKEKIRNWALKSSLGAAEPQPDFSDLADLSSDALSQIISLETDRLKSDQAEFAREQANLEVMMKQANDRNEALTDQLKTEEDGFKLDAADMARVEGLFHQGLIPASRVTEVRRALLLSASRALQIRIAAENALKERNEIQFRAEALRNARRLGFVKDLGESTTKLGEHYVQLKSVKEKLSMTGAPRMITSPLEVATADIQIFRRTGSEQKSFQAHEDTELEPGDLVEVSFQASFKGRTASSYPNERRDITERN